MALAEQIASFKMDPNRIGKPFRETDILLQPVEVLGKQFEGDDAIFAFALAGRQQAAIYRRHLGSIPMTEIFARIAQHAGAANLAAKKIAAASRRARNNKRLARSFPAFRRADRHVWQISRENGGVHPARAVP